MAVTQKDIAEQLGISRVLVSYALNGNPRVSEATRQRVLETARTLGYQPNHAARALVTGRTGHIALCFSSPHVSFTTELSRRFQLLAHASSYDLLVSNIEALEHTNAPLAVDGAICFGVVPQPLIARNFPAVSLQVDLRGASAGQIGLHDVIQITLEEAARDAMKHLLAQGCQRVAFVSTSEMMGKTDPRFRAYSSALESAGLETEEIVTEFSDYLHLREKTQYALEQYFEKHGFPDALFCSNDDIAIGAYRALRECEREIPRQTAVIGCDDIEESRDHCPALASIHWPSDAVCQSAWQMLMQRIAEPSLPPRFERVQAQFVPRASSQAGSTPAATPGEFLNNLAARRKNHANAEKKLQPS